MSESDVSVITVEESIDVNTSSSASSNNLHQQQRCSTETSKFQRPLLFWTKATYIENYHHGFHFYDNRRETFEHFPTSPV